MKHRCRFIIAVLLIGPLLSCESGDDTASSQQTVYIAPANLSGVKLEFQDENGSSEGDLRLNTDGSAELSQVSGWLSSNYFGFYEYERHDAEEAVIYASYNLVETNMGGSLVSESADLTEQYFLFFDDPETGGFSRFSGSNAMDGTFTVVDIE